MTGALNKESAPQSLAVGYADREVTKPPNWHALVVLDVLLNNLSTGLFLVAGLAELVDPVRFGGLAPAAFALALLFLFGDLVCLVLDLGDPLRFHHMLRVWKPGSPMSLGTWCLTLYGAFLTAVALLSWVPEVGAPGWLRSALFLIGLVPALGASVYKGVLFSTTAQPGWRDARWMGAYFSCSAPALGAAGLLLLAMLLRRPEAVAALRTPLAVLLALNLVALLLLLGDLRRSLSRLHRPGYLTLVGAATILGGALVPLGLLVLGGRGALVGAVLLTLAGAAAVRYEIVRLPHLLTRAAAGQVHAAERPTL